MKILLFIIICIFIVCFSLCINERFDNLVDPPKKTQNKSLIPKIIIQTFADKKKIAQKVYNNKKFYAPDYKHIVYDDNQCLKFIKRFNAILSEKDLGETWFSLKKGAHRADLFRYCYLYINGGVYLDIKTELIEPLNITFPKKNILYTVLSKDINTIYQGVIATPPENPIFMDLIEYIVNNVFTINKKYSSCTRDFYKKIVIYSQYNKLRNGFYKNKLGDIDFYLFKEICGNKKKCTDGLDRHGLCCNIYDNSKVKIKTRYSDYTINGWN
mgnify:CR=1 FL=1|tara:strand:- start:502 stop:1311 length:810 start_codon:yes stop_codon:yes gene_type:complete